MDHLISDEPIYSVSYRPLGHTEPTGNLDVGAPALRLKGCYDFRIQIVQIG
jgi:hypothetical protein